MATSFVKLLGGLALLWMLLVTGLLLHVLTAVHSVLDAQRALPARTVELHALREQRAPPPPVCPVVKCPPPVPCPDPPPPPVAAASDVALNPAARPERVRPLLHWLGLDGGRDFFLHLITWNKQARQSHALIVEVGAGDGRQAVRAAQLGFTVISIDASASNLQIGKDFQNAAKEPIEGNLTWIHSAVSDYRGEAHFWTQKGIGRLLDSKDPKGVTHKDNPKWRGDTERVPVNRLDDLVTQRPYILKVDVEGHELSVFRGASKLLAKRPSIVIFEFNPAMMLWSARHHAYELLRLFHDLGYELYDSQISEPGKKGFVQKYGSFHRPADFRGLVQWFNKSTEFDWWGSWTDIVAVYPE